MCCLFAPCVTLVLIDWGRRELSRVLWLVLLAPVDLFDFSVENNFPISCISLKTDGLKENCMCINLYVFWQTIFRALM